VIHDLGVVTLEHTGYAQDWVMAAVEPPPAADRVRVVMRDDTVGFE
jgi:hypothetical protein